MRRRIEEITRAFVRRLTGAPTKRPRFVAPRAISQSSCVGTADQLSAASDEALHGGRSRPPSGYARARVAGTVCPSRRALRFRRGACRYASLANLYCAFGMTFVRGCYHQILGPRRHLPKLSNGLCRHAGADVRLNVHLGWQALKFPGIRPISGTRDYSRLSCDIGDTQPIETVRRARAARQLVGTRLTSLASLTIAATSSR